jgi:glycosyltransferase involved in cell wall biosynthesis
VLVQDETMLGSLPRRLRRRTVVLGQAVRGDPLPEQHGSDRAGVLFLSDRARPVKRFWLAQAAVASAVPGLELRSLDELAPQDVLAAMSRARVGLLTSEREGMPVAVKEALRCGLPVVATDLPPLRPVAAGLPFAVTLAGPDETSLAAALNDVLARPPLTAPQRAEVERYLADRGWLEPQHSRRLIALYRELARHRPAPGHRWGYRA